MTRPSVPGAACRGGIGYGSGAVGMFNADNTIRPNGIAFRDFVRRCDGRINCGRDKPRKRRHSHKRHRH